MRSETAISPEVVTLLMWLPDVRCMADVRGLQTVIPEYI